MNKIILQIQLRVWYAVVFLLTSISLKAQDSILNKYGLLVITSTKQLHKIIIDTPAKSMSDLKKRFPVWCLT